MTKGKFKKGDLVCLSQSAQYMNRYNMMGIIIEKVDEPRAMHNDVFKVWWTDGTVGNNVWDYDLKVMNESR